MCLPYLLDAITEEAFTTPGCSRGTVTTERQRAVRSARRQDRDASESEIRARAATELESTFPSRLEEWRHLAPRRVAKSA